MIKNQKKLNKKQIYFIIELFKIKNNKQFKANLKIKFHKRCQIKKKKKIKRKFYEK